MAEDIKKVVEEVKPLDYAQIDERKKEIRTMLDEDEALNLEDIVKLTDEVDALDERRKEIKNTVEKRAELLNTVANMKDANILESKTRGDSKMAVEERKYTAGSVEYRDAFLKNLLGETLSEVEERAFLHTTENTGEVIPEELQNKIYTNMEEQHPLLADVQVLRTGAVISIVKHTEIVAGDARQVDEGEANEAEENTFVNVTLSGKDFSKHVDFSYRLGKMAIPAFEQYLTTEIANRLGAAMTADIVAQIKLDANADNQFEVATPGTLAKADILQALGQLKQVGKVNVYTGNGTFYGAIANLEGAEGLVSFIPNYQDAIAGQVFGKGIKIEDALADGDLLFLDPQQFIYNVVQDIMIERDRDIKKHVHTLAGFAIAEGTLTNDKAAVVLSVGAGA